MHLQRSQTKITSLIEFHERKILQRANRNFSFLTLPQYILILHRIDSRNFPEKLRYCGQEARPPYLPHSLSETKYCRRARESLRLGQIYSSHFDVKGSPRPFTGRSSSIRGSIATIAAPRHTHTHTLRATFAFRRCSPLVREERSEAWMVMYLTETFDRMRSSYV